MYPADHAGLLLVAGMAGAVEREVAQRRELGFGAVQPLRVTSGSGWVKPGYGGKMTVKLIGRDGEAAEISAFISGLSGGAAALAITGDPGVGKTSVWKHVVETAGGPFRVLTSQPASAERPLAFSALDDLFADAVNEVLPGLPGPRRRALEAALLRDMTPGQAPRESPDAGPSATERRVLARGILDTVRALASRIPLMVAVDDVSGWTDRQPVCGVLHPAYRTSRSPSS